MTLFTAQVRDVTPGPSTVTDACIMHHLTNFDASLNVILHMRYVSTCVGARVVEGGWEPMNNKVIVYLPSLMMKVPNHL
jgi:hypothetical protein